MCAHGAPQRHLQVVGIGKDTLGLFVDFVFCETIQTFHLTGFIPEVVARAEWAFSVWHREVHWSLTKFFERGHAHMLFSIRFLDEPTAFQHSYQRPVAFAAAMFQGRCSVDNDDRR